MRELHELETPAAVVDLDALDRNLDGAASYARTHGLSLRPHVKTHKAPWIAGEQLRRGAVGLTCATPREAEVMRPVAEDLLVAYPPIGLARASRIAALAAEGRVTVALDSVEAADAIARAASAVSARVGVFVELDLGMRRVGVADVGTAISIARRVADAPSLSYEGIAFYPGHIRDAVTSQDDALTSLDGRLTEIISAMADAGVKPRVVSGGSTPTLWNAHHVTAMTEMRPGTYVFNDRTTAAIGACAWSDCALTVLATVVSTAVRGQAVIDAGTKSLGREPMRGADGTGFGSLVEHPEVIVASMSEEHGILDLSMTDWTPRVGEIVRVIPNHVCIVIHLNDEVYGVRGTTVERRWDVAARGRSLVPPTPTA